jgi:hypothetical protein
MIDLEKMSREHVPNTPRKRDAQGKPVNEPVQCCKDLQAWPCDTKKLIDMIKDMDNHPSPSPIKESVANV